LQPERDGRVRCSAWLGNVVVITQESPRQNLLLADEVKLPPLAVATEEAKPCAARTILTVSIEKPNHKNLSPAK
jgi:hypothetical protein